MKKYKFYIEASKEVIVEGNNCEEARMKLINNLNDECDDIIGMDTCISDGDEVKNEERKK